ncbi:hypothetical protein HRbin39_01743 [bacterium HR39]|nr:hypothetical protein HRbin39_01743 [bacterium HR39]
MPGIPLRTCGATRLGPPGALSRRAMPQQRPHPPETSRADRPQDDAGAPSPAGRRGGHATALALGPGPSFARGPSDHRGEAARRGFCAGGPLPDSGPRSGPGALSRRARTLRRHGRREHAALGISFPRGTVSFREGAPMTRASRPSRPDRPRGSAEELLGELEEALRSPAPAGERVRPRQDGVRLSGSPARERASRRGTVGSRSGIAHARAGALRHVPRPSRRLWRASASRGSCSTPSSRRPRARPASRPARLPESRFDPSGYLHAAASSVRGSRRLFS